MVRDSVTHLRESRQAGSSSTPSTSSTATPPTRRTRSRCCGWRRSRVPTSRCCATPTAGGCPTRWPTSCTPSAGRPARGSASTATTTPAARWPTRWPPSTRAPPTCRARSTATASAPATPTSSRSSPTSQLKRARQVLPEGRLREATRVTHAVSELANVPPYSRQPYVGASAFAHKAGLHASAVRVDPMLYQHEDPESVGNDMRMLISDMAGRASIELKGRELGYDLAGNTDAPQPGHREGQGPGGRRATRSRRQTRRSSCCSARRSRAARRTSSASSRGGSSSTRTPTRTPRAARPRPRRP